MKRITMISTRTFTLVSFAVLFSATCALAQAPQATPPPPTAPHSAAFPKPAEKTLPNGLRVVVPPRSQMPLVTAQLLIKSGGEVDPSELAGAADTTAALPPTGPTPENATQLAAA